MTNKYESVGVNEILRKKGFHISYNPVTDTGAETAVVVGSSFYILLGDYRENYVKAETVEKAKSIFDALVENGAEVSPWSN